MKVTQEKLPASQVGLEIEIPSDLSQKTYERVIQNFQRSANIPGFRKGKVPRQILLQRLGIERIKAAAIEDLINNALKDAISQEKIEAIGQYELSSSFEDLLAKYTPGEPLTFSAKVDIPPSVTLLQYEGLSIQAEEIKYDPKQTETFFEQHRNEHATLIPVEDRPAQLGDVAIVDFEGKLKGEGDAEPEPFPGGSAEDFQMDLAEGKFIPGFVEAVVGMKPEETKEIPLDFPEDYGSPDLAGKAAIFTLTLKELKEKDLPELDDDFAQEISEFETMSELHESIESRHKSEAQNKTDRNIRSALLAALIDQIEVELPETMVRHEIDTLLTQRAMQLEQYGVNIKELYTPENIPQIRERSREEALVRLKQDLALKEIAKQHALVADPEAIEQQIEELTEQLGARNVDPARLEEYVTTDLLKDKAIEWLKERANIELVPEGSLSKEEDEDEDEDADGEEAEAVEVEVMDSEA
jgi:trigger factor